jgi:hypothetical protein
MWVELAIRFVLGGVLVSFFAALAEMLEPKTFAGVFGAAPSVALATLALAFHHHGASYVASEGRTMILGAVALLAYSSACVVMATGRREPVWLGAVAAWAVWVAVAFGLWWLTEARG